jgi:hypothetical protein
MGWISQEGVVIRTRHAALRLGVVLTSLQLNQNLVERVTPSLQSFYRAERESPFRKTMSCATANYGQFSRLSVREALGRSSTGHGSAGGPGCCGSCQRVHAIT